MKKLIFTLFCGLIFLAITSSIVYAEDLAFTLSFDPNPVMVDENVIFIIHTLPMDPWPDGYGSAHAVCITRVPCFSYDECLALGEAHLFCQAPDISGLTIKTLTPEERELFGLNSPGEHELFAGCSRNDIGTGPGEDRDWLDPGETTNGTLEVCNPDGTRTDGKCHIECGAVPECDDLLPDSPIPYCDCPGTEPYFACRCDGCTWYADINNICMSRGLLGPDDFCMAHDACNGREAGTSWCDGDIKKSCSSSCGYSEENCEAKGWRYYCSGGQCKYSGGGGGGGCRCLIAPMLGVGCIDECTITAMIVAIVFVGVMVGVLRFVPKK